MTSSSRRGRKAIISHAQTTGDEAGCDALAAPSPARLAVERVISELRAGRPIRVRQGTEGRLVFSIEHAAESPERLAEIADFGVARLVLPQERLEHIGVKQSSGGAMRVIGSDHALVCRLALARSVDDVPAFQAADAIETGAMDALKFAQLLPSAVVVQEADPDQHGWVLEVSVAALQSFHHEVADALEIVSRAPVPLSDASDTEFVVFRGSDGLKDQVAIVVGSPNLADEVPVRLHSACLTGDLFGSLKCDCGEQLRRAVRSFADNGGGILLYLDQEGRGIGLANKMRAYALQHDGYDTLDADRLLGYGDDARRYRIAARMLALLGVSRVSVLTNNPRKIAALTAFGIEVAGRVALVGTPNPHNARYLKTKVERAGHLPE